MKKFLLVISALALSAILPGIASAQSDIDGEKLTTEVKIGTVGSNYSDGRTSATGFVDVTQRLNSKFTVEGLVQGGQYFGSDFAGAGGSLLFHPTSGSYIQVGGFRNSQTQTTQVYNGFFEVGTLVYRARGIVADLNDKGNVKVVRPGLIKAIELDYNQTWEGFGLAPNQTAVHSFSPRAIVYLPAGIDLSIRGGIVDIIQNGIHNPQPTGGARIRVPVTRRLALTASAGFDSEGVTNIAQIASFSTRNYGAGATFWLNRTTSIEGEGYTSLYTANHLSGNTYRIVLRKRF